jgi:hypothetical protein
MTWIEVHDRFQSNYCYRLECAEGQDFDNDFKPQLTPMEMLRLGVFGGCYMTDGANEFPSHWFAGAKLSPGKYNSSVNYFSVEASQSLQVWQAKGWLYHEDPRGWFQWYCRYYRGRRIEVEDRRQIKRWRAFRRHWMAVIHYCEPFDHNCRKKQRQALLHWAYDSRNI